jgi:hypothetical protein
LIYLAGGMSSEAVSTARRSPKTLMWMIAFTGAHPASW